MKRDDDTHVVMEWTSCGASRLRMLRRQKYWSIFTVHVIDQWLEWISKKYVSRKIFFVYYLKFC